MPQTTDSFIWGNLLHLSTNLWNDHPTPEGLPGVLRYGHLGSYIQAYRAQHGDGILDYLSIAGPRPYLRFDQAVWDELLHAMAAAGMNLIVLDLGDGVQYETHPEIAVQGAWTVNKLREELDKARSLGIEVVPKLNFSACHDVWMGDYARRVSTPEYYAVCRDLIDEVADIFQQPRLFHLGMDEEIFATQAGQHYIVLRQGELWWHDLLFLVQAVESHGGRAWIWGDGAWNKVWAPEASWHMEDEFLDRVPRSVLVSSWYYDKGFRPEDFVTEDEQKARDGRLTILRAYEKLDRAGFDQIPTVSNIKSPENLAKTAAHCARVLHPDQLKGYLMTTWVPTVPEFRDFHLEAIRLMGEARAQAEG